MGERAGIIIMGSDYSYLAVERAANGTRLVKASCADAGNGAEEIVEAEIRRPGEFVWLRVKVETGTVCLFCYSNDGKKFTVLGKLFTAREGKWIGAKIGLFCLAPFGAVESSHADFDWFRFE